jgi:serine/threonine protein kinase
MLQLLNGAHPNVMRMVDASMIESEGISTFSMVMPKAAGSLSSAISDKSLGGKAKVKVAGMLLHALAWMADQNVMHRDIKPDNILLTDANDPIICDFSLAKVVYPTSVLAAAAAAPKAGGKKKKAKKEKRKPAGVEGTRNSEGAGTPTYIAPEIVCGGTDYDTQVDVWSMGVVFYEMFNNQMLSVDSDKKALKLIEQVE